MAFVAVWRGVVRSGVAHSRQALNLRNPILGDTAMTENEHKVLDALSERDGGIYSSEISAYSNVSKSAISGVISSLVKKGYIRKSKIGNDEYLEISERVIFGYYSSSGPKTFFLRKA
jgi:uncharacterized membrane protein